MKKIAYLDASVVLSDLLGERIPSVRKRLSDFDGWTSSALIEIEIARTLDRMRLRGKLTDLQLVEISERSAKIIRSVELIEISKFVQKRAREPFSLPIGSLDAIHLASALLYHDVNEAQNFVFFTFDEELGLAARSMGLSVEGIGN